MIQTSPLQKVIDPFNRFGTKSGVSPVFTTDMTVGDGGGYKGYRQGKWSSSLSDRDYAVGSTLSRVYLYSSDSGATALPTINWASGIPLVDLWLQYDDEAYVAYPLHASETYHVGVYSAANGDVWDYLAANIGSVVEVKFFNQDPN